MKLLTNTSSFYKKIKPSIYYIVAALFLLYEMGVQSSPSVMANRLLHDLHIGADTLGIAMGMYFISYTLMQIPVGLLYDRFPAKRLLVFATLVCASGSVLFSFGEHVMLLGLARFLTGLGSAFAFVGVLVIASQWFHASKFALLVGVAQMLAAVGALVGQRPLAYWVSIWGWQYTMQVLALIGLGLAVMMLLILRTRHRCSEQPQPRLPRASLQHIFANRQTLWIALYAFTAWAPIAGFAELWAGPYLMAKLHVSSVIAANYTTWIWVALGITSPLLGYFSDRLGRRRPFLMVCSILGLVGVSVLLYLPMSSHTVEMVGMLTIGIAAAAQILSFALIRDNFPQQDLAVAIGIINMSVVIGGALFQPLVGLLLSWQHPGVAQSYSIANFQWALWLLPLCYFVGLWVSSVKIKDLSALLNR